ncbi:inactive ubiquitin thioesterase OTULINL isoform X2 [Pyxicephalus adspersus]|uniref:inactive ubiquitin thioesterase OTULINL isoform X2 n=1 Tax=Pyxicephalus adspersus TaxID=30357 RepID=UPI003B58FB76
MDMSVPGNIEDDRQLYHRRHEAVAARSRLSSPPSHTDEEQSRVPPLFEVISKVWNQVQKCLVVAVAVLFLMWQHFKALISLWCSFPCQIHFKNRRNLSVNAEVDVLSYCSKKWKGEAPNVTYMRKAYETLYWKHHIKTLQHVKQDNYCVLRAVMFQVFSQGIPLPGWMKEKDILKLPEKLLYSQGCNWIQQFSFGHEKYTGPKVYGKLRSCLEIFKNQWGEFHNCKDQVERNKMCKSVFSDETTENKLYEALKFIMLSLVIDAYENIKSAEQSPRFFHFLFSRDTSSDPLSYMMNHLNAVGDTSGLEQADMCLVGYALEVKIKLFRLDKMNTEDFEIYYPDNYKRDWHEISLMTDDNHYYNIPVKAI